MVVRKLFNPQYLDENETGHKNDLDTLLEWYEGHRWLPEIQYVKTWALGRYRERGRIFIIPIDIINNENFEEEL